MLWYSASLHHAHLALPAFTHAQFMEMTPSARRLRPAARSTGATRVAAAAYKLANECRLAGGDLYLRVDGAEFLADLLHVGPDEARVARRA